jgi:hypothetical protein
VPTVALDVERLGTATMPDIKAAAAKYARKDIELMFSETKIANSAWYEESKVLIHDTVEIDKATFNELRGTHPADGSFSQTELARRFESLNLKGIDGIYVNSSTMEASLRSWKINDAQFSVLKPILQTQLQASYEKVLIGEVLESKNALIEAIQTEQAFEDGIRAKASEVCANVRSAAVEQFNHDMKIAMEASIRDGGKFIDVEKQIFADFEEAVEERT